MTINSKTVTWYGYISIGVLFVLLAVVWLNLVDPSMHVAILIVAALLISSRILLRFVARHQEDGGKGRTSKGSADNDGTDA